MSVELDTHTLFHDSVFSNGKRPRLSDSYTNTVRPPPKRKAMEISPTTAGLSTVGCVTDIVGNTDGTKMTGVPLEASIILGGNSKEAVVRKYDEPTYAQDIYVSHRQKEEIYWKTKPKSNLPTKQPQISEPMRSVLIDWLIEVADEFKLKDRTVFLAVNYVDRVLENVQVTVEILQLVGVTCLFVAAKYEEIYAPLVDEFVEVTDNTYTHEEILQTEMIVLNTLKFRLTVTTIKDFLPRFIMASNIQDPRIEHHCNYLAEMVLLFYSFQINYPPSLLAASIVCLSKNSYQLPFWSPTFESYTGYSKTDLKECIVKIYDEHKLLLSSTKHKSVREKYSKPQYGCVAQQPLSLPFL